MAFEIFGIGMGLFLLALGIWAAVRRLWSGPTPKAEPLPPLDADETADFIAWHQRQRAPMVRLDVRASLAAPKLGSCRLGGPAWLEGPALWPLGRDGTPMLHLAQIDFAGLPPLADFPERGLLQFFIAADEDCYGCDFDNPLNGDFQIIWQPDPPATGAWVQRQTGAPSSNDPLGALAASAGRLLTPVLASQLPGWSAAWSMRDKDLGRRSAGLDAYWESFDSQETAFDIHHIGGYPDFVQNDFRDADCCPDHDVVLLQLWSTPMDDICWGDAGQANFMIRRADLRARDFSQVSYQWDCS